MISLATSYIGKQTRVNITKALDDNRIGQGKFNEEFERRVAAYLGVKHAVATCNGTMADMVALAALKAKRPDKTQVIVPALTFIAQTNAVLANGLEPVFVDVGYDYQMDVNQVEEKIGTNTLAIMAVNLLGNKCDHEKLVRLAIKHDVFLMEDNCEAYGLRPHGEFATYSFFPSHTITTGEGGMVVTDDDELAELARSATNHGRHKDGVLNKFHFKHFGFNGKMSNVLAAIGCAVVDTASTVIEKRKKNVETYNQMLNKNWYAASPHCYPLMYPSQDERDKVLTGLDKARVEARKIFSCLPVQEEVYEYMGFVKGSFPVAEDIGNRGLFVPVHQDLTEDNIRYVCNLL